MTEMQKQFEEWARSVSHNMVPGGNLDRSYLSYETQIAYEAWVASRAAVVVKTDTMKDPSYEATGMVYLDAVEQVLDEAGIRYE